MSGVKLVRGYTEPGKAKEPAVGSKGPSTPTSAALRPTDVPSALQLDERQQKLLKRRSAPPTITRPESPVSMDPVEPTIPQGEMDEEMEAEAVRKRDGREIQNDYHDRDGENQGREIEHLILVTHGIGQRLGMRYASRQMTQIDTIAHGSLSRTESVNFIHDVNVLRQNLKNVYSSSGESRISCQLLAMFANVTI